VKWLRNPPPQAERLAQRWARRPHRDGYESKIDAVLTDLPKLDAHERAHGEALGVEGPWGPTTIVAPSLRNIAAAHEAMGRGEIAEKPLLFVNIPSVLDEKMRPQDGGHVLSLEVLFTPYELRGGWEGSPEPERWLDVLGGLLDPGFRELVRGWRVMTPPAYEEQFNLRRGHAPSFAGGAVAALLGRERELTRYETPVPGLYLTGAATFPGAGVWGASGRNTAAVVLRGRSWRRTALIARARAARSTTRTSVPA